MAPGAANLNWTVAPRLEIGYRLPSGFGAFAFSDRFFQTGGAGPFSGPVGLTNRTSRLTVNYCDWDYISHEFTPWVTPKSNWTLECAPASGSPIVGPITLSISRLAGPR